MKPLSIFTVLSFCCAMNAQQSESAARSQTIQAGVDRTGALTTITNTWGDASKPYEQSHDRTDVYNAKFGQLCAMGVFNNNPQLRYQIFNTIAHCYMECSDQDGWKSDAQNQIVDGTAYWVAANVAVDNAQWDDAYNEATSAIYSFYLVGFDCGSIVSSADRVNSALDGIKTALGF